MKKTYLAVALSSWFVLGTAALLHPDFSCNRWDNFEYFTPAIMQAHGEWLQGSLPRLNWHQHMGESILVGGQPGVFYFPYTICVLVVKTLGISPNHLMTVNWFFHLPILPLGVFVFAQFLGVRAPLAWLMALSACFSGYAASLGLLWSYVVPIMAWLPWVCWGLAATMRDGYSVRGSLVAALGLGAIGWLGYPQLFVYASLFAALFALLYATLVLRQPRRVFAAAALMVAGGLLGSPTFMPMMEGMKYMTRPAKFSLAEFLVGSMDYSTLLGWFLPVIRAENKFIPDSASLIAFQGAWVAGALIAAGFALRRGLAASDDGLKRAFWALASVTLLFVLFALGPNGFIYRLTYGIPIWSAFRWPCKFFLMGQFGLIMTAGVGLELAARANPSRTARIAAAAAPIAIAAILLATRAAPNLNSAAGIVCVICALASMALIAWPERSGAQRGLVAAAVIGTIALATLQHNPMLKRYREPYALTPPELLGIDNNFRAIPITNGLAQSADDPVLQEYGIYHSATMNGYFSATGNTAGVIPTWFEETLPGRVDGVMPYEVSAAVLNTNLARSFNIKYLIVSPNDAEGMKVCNSLRGYKEIKRLPRTVVFANDDALPRVYFATHLFAYDEKRFMAGMIANQAPPRSAFVAGIKTQDRALPAASVTHFEFGHRGVSVDVDAPQGGMLVVSASFYPDWTASADGKPAPLYMVNDRVLGVEVPAGAKHVELEYAPESLTAGLALGAVGALLLAGIIVWTRRKFAAA